MSALFTALLESETKETLTDMVCKLRSLLHEYMEYNANGCIEGMSEDDLYERAVIAVGHPDRYEPTVAPVLGYRL